MPSSKPSAAEVEDRSFLHDLATPLTVARSLAQRACKELAKAGEELDRDALVKRLEKIVTAVEEMQRLHADHKARLHLRYHGPQEDAAPIEDRRANKAAS